MKIHSVSHTGNVRESNEDRVLVVEEHNLFSVADGMGGHAGGEVASELCVQMVARASASLPHLGAADRLVSAVHFANSEVYRTAENTFGLKGMGTTVIAATIDHNILHVVHVGDSRAYLSTATVIDPATNTTTRRLYKLTRDHSLAEELVAQGDVAGARRAQNILTQCVGHEPRIHPTIISHSVQAGDRLLLCSDGLWTEVEPVELHALLTGPDPAESLLAAALRNGGHDNVSIVVVEL